MRGSVCVGVQLEAVDVEGTAPGMSEQPSGSGSHKRVLPPLRPGIQSPSCSARGTLPVGSRRGTLPPLVERASFMEEE